MEIENVRVAPLAVVRQVSVVEDVVAPLLATFAVVAALFPVMLFVLTIAPVAGALALPFLVWAARRRDAGAPALSPPPVNAR